MAKTIPNKDVEFDEWQKVIYAMTSKNQAAWGINEAWFTSRLTPANTGWDAACAAWQDPAQRTPLITFTKNARRKEYETLLRILVLNLQCNTQVTDDQRRAAGVVIRDRKPTPVKAPAEYPLFRIDSSMIRLLIIYFQALIMGGRSRAKPHGVHGADIRWAILATAPASVDELTNSSFDTRSPFTLTFDERDRGKTAYFCLRWESTRGEKGPWS
ncbi:MAG: hypothetical protein LBJ47_11800, partial [Tannerella sp.]|nr:hypothetical protein [Tannerella sp.]